MSTATSVEKAGRWPFSWTPVVVGGLMIVALIVGLLLQQGRDDAAAPSRAAVRETTVLNPTADYGIRHLQRTEAPSLEATADWGIRHLGRPFDAQLLTHSRELDASADYGIRHAQQFAPRFSLGIDDEISHPQQGVRPFDYGRARMNALDISRGRRAETARLEAAADFYRSQGQRR
jgi:hypothetical protein